MRMKKLILSIALIFCMPLALACNYPAPPKSIPDGTASNKNEILAGVKMIAAYQEDMSTYLSCIEADAKKVLEKFARQKRKSSPRPQSEKCLSRNIVLNIKLSLRCRCVRWNCSTPKFVPLKHNQSDITVIRSLVTIPRILS